MIDIRSGSELRCRPRQAGRQRGSPVPTPPRDSHTGPEGAVNRGRGPRVRGRGQRRRPGRGNGPRRWRRPPTSLGMEDLPPPQKTRSPLDEASISSGSKLITPPAKAMHGRDLDCEGVLWEPGAGGRGGGGGARGASGLGRRVVEEDPPPPVPRGECFPIHTGKHLPPQQLFPSARIRPESHLQGPIISARIRTAAPGSAKRRCLHTGHHSPRNQTPRPHPNGGLAAVRAEEGARPKGSSSTINAVRWCALSPPRGAPLLIQNKILRGVFRCGDPGRFGIDRSGWCVVGFRTFLDPPPPGRGEGGLASGGPLGGLPAVGLRGRIGRRPRAPWQRGGMHAMERSPPQG